MSDIENMKEAGEVKGLNYYERHLGDYAKETRHLSLLEHGVYTILLDYCFATCQPIPQAQIYRYACARTRGEKRAVDAVLAEFFFLQAGMYFSKLVKAYREAKDKRAQTSKENGKLGGRPAKKAEENDKPNDNNRLENEKPNQNLTETYQEPNPNLKKPVPIAINPLVQHSINPIANSPLAINPEATSKSIALPTGSAKKTGAAREYRAEFTLPEWEEASQGNSPAATAGAEPESYLEDPAFDLKTNTPGPEVHLAEPMADLNGARNALESSLVHANDPDKGIIHADYKSVKNEQKETVSKKPALTTPAAAPAVAIAVAEPVIEAAPIAMESLSKPNEPNERFKGVPLDHLNASTGKPKKTRPTVAVAEAVTDVPTGKGRKKELTQEQRNLNATIWQRYQAAYVERYGADPVRNAKVNKQINDLRERLGHEAPDVAAFYVTINDQWLIRTGHTVGNLLQGCEGYRTQWATGRQVNSVTARHMENTQANIETVKQVTQKMASSNYVNPLDRLMAYGNKTFNEIAALEAQA